MSDEVTGIHATGTVANLGAGHHDRPDRDGRGHRVELIELVELLVLVLVVVVFVVVQFLELVERFGGDPVRVPLTVRPTTALAAALNGENVLVTVDTGQTEGPVLTVPVAAVVATASGASFVTVAGARGGRDPGAGDAGHLRERVRAGHSPDARSAARPARTWW